MKIRLSHADGRPLYVQIMDEVRSGLVRGSLRPEDPLPSVRELSSSLRVNPRTVSQAYAALERDGVVLVRHGKGTFVAPGVRPDERERPRLAREVARRALADASRNGLALADLMTALREVEGGDPHQDGDGRKEGGQ
ncbi:MAG: GntR family transcriptional regulator [Gemmatimonadota bacterium]|nr:GntR family transcriptional regulator [Gemmatimonadota bacterium]MDE2866357.1 GntR family transcriptional regulator [Gemmatimonadota bacterium]